MASSWPSQEQMLSDMILFFNNPLVSTPLMVLISTVVFVVLFFRASSPSKMQTIEDVMREFGGSVAMIFFCFTPGPFLGHLNGYEEWLCHGLGLLIADYISGGPHCNPAVSLAMVLFGEISADQFLVKVSAQMIAGIVAFPLLQTVCTPYGITIGGPEFNAVDVNGAMFDEAVGTFVLMVAVAMFCMTWFGRYYLVRMTLIAATIRVICQVLNRAGPSLNPMLGTTFYFFKYHNWPQTTEHYLVYWASPMAGGAVAVVMFSLIWKFLPPPDERRTLRKVWAAYYKASISKDSNMETVVSFFDSGAKLVVCADAKLRELSPNDEAFTSHFYKLATAQSKVTVAPEVVVDEAARTVFVKWKVANGLTGTDTIIFSGDSKIIRQHTTFTK